MNKATTLISVGELIPMLTAIYARDWEKFKELEVQFVNKYDVESWEKFFAFRLKPALDKNSDKWLLGQLCQTGIVSVKGVA